MKTKRALCIAAFSEDLRPDKKSKKLLLENNPYPGQKVKKPFKWVNSWRFGALRELFWDRKTPLRCEYFLSNPAMLALSKPFLLRRKPLKSTLFEDVSVTNNVPTCSGH